MVEMLTINYICELEIFLWRRIELLRVIKKINETSFDSDKYSIFFKFNNKYSNRDTKKLDNDDDDDDCEKGRNIWIPTETRTLNELKLKNRTESRPFKQFDFNLHEFRVRLHFWWEHRARRRATRNHYFWRANANENAAMW